MKNLIKTALLVVALIALAPQAHAATQEQRCQSRQNTIIGEYTSCSYRAKSGLSESTTIKNCTNRFERRWETAIENFAKKDVTCVATPTSSRVYRRYINSKVNDITTLTGKTAKNLNRAQRNCRAVKTLKVGSYAACRSRAEAKLAGTANTATYNEMIGQCETTFANEWQRIINRTARRGTTCFDNSHPMSEYKSIIDTQTNKIAGVLAGTDLFNPVSISVSGSPLSLDAGGATGNLTVTNDSSSRIATNIQADFSNTALAGNVTVTVTTCQSVAPGATCTLTLQTENTVVGMTGFTIKGSNTTEASAVLTITAPQAILSLSGSPLELVNGGGSGVLSITNTSTISTATDITALLTGTALEGNVTVTGNTCSSVTPGGGCTITFTPGNSDLAQTDFVIQGSNTNALSAAISITTPPPTTATLSISGSPLQLTVNGTTGGLTVTNTSGVVTAVNITSSFTGTALDGNVTETGNTCASVLPGASCTLTFTPGSTTVAPTSFSIEGTNTTTATASIEVQSGSTLASVSASSGAASGGTGVTLTGTGLTGATAITFGGVAATSINVINSTTVTAVTPAHAVGAVDVVISTPAGGATLTDGFTFVTTTVGQPVYGGIIACLGGGLQNLIAASADNSTGIAWGGNGIVTNATDNDDGFENTTTIVTILGGNGGTPYAAQLCSNYEVDSQGNTPCEAGNTCYNDWFLPALSQLDCSYGNRISIGGFSSDLYWSSIEDSAFYSWVVDFSDGTQQVPGGGKGGGSYRVRCLREFVA